MNQPFFTGPGGVLSADIAVPEHARELAFYASVLTTGSKPLWQDDLMNSEGTPIIGLGERIPAYEALPLQWMPHIQVADVAASAASAIDQGAQELMHGRDDKGQSQWAVMIDPNGAAFGLIPAVEGTYPGTENPQGTGHIAGLTLVAPDAIAAGRFYEQVVGWTAVANDDGCDLQGSDGVTVAMIRPAEKEPAEIPPTWLIHLPVDDLAESLVRVRDHGGTVISETAGVVVIQDLVGVFCTLQASR